MEKSNWEKVSDLYTKMCLYRHFEDTWNLKQFQEKASVVTLMGNISAVLAKRTRYEKEEAQKLSEEIIQYGKYLWDKLDEKLLREGYEVDIDGNIRKVENIPEA